MGKYTKLHSYVKAEWWQLKRDELVVERKANEARRDIDARDPGAHANSNKVKYNPRVFSLMGELNVIKQGILVSESYLEIYDRYIQTLSRELTRKGNERTSTSY